LLPKQWWLLMEQVLIRALWKMRKFLPTWLLWLSQTQRDASFKDSESNALNIQMEQLKKENESNKFKIDTFKNASKSLDKLIGSQIFDNSRKGVGFVSYNVVPPPPTGLFAPLTIDLSNSGLKEFQQPEFKGYGHKASKCVCKDTSNEVKKTPDAPLAKPKVVNTARLTLAVVNAVRANQVNAIKASACWVWRPTKLNSASITFKRQNYIDPRGKPKHMTGNMSYLSDFKEFDREYVTFGGGARGGRITGKRTLKTGKLDFEDVFFVKELQFNLFSVSQMCDKKNSNRVIIVKPQNKTPYELFRGRTPALSFMRPFGCYVTILNTLDHLGKFNGKSDDGFFVGYSLTSKAFRVYNIRTRKVEENLLIRFLENKPIVTGSKESNGAGHTSKETEFSQDYIVMPLWKDGLMFDYSLKNSSDDEPQPSSNAEKKDDEGVSKVSRFSDQEQPEGNTLNINTVGPSINTASVNFKTGSQNINTVSLTVITTRSNRSQNVSNIFSLGRSATLVATHADLFDDETEMDMSNLTTSYQVSTTPNTRIHKDCDW
ncbi:ribonuclease H-like domain-containing protein, partial [Tanacetum coccineum]